MLNLKNIILKVCDVIKTNATYLTDLDVAIGDGDHGVNLNRGFSKIAETVSEWENLSVDKIFNKIGMTLLSNVGGASGALYGSGFLKIGNYLKTNNINNWNDFATILKVMLDEIQNRGKSEIKQKTMLDTLIPFYETLIKGLNTNLKINQILNEALKAAEVGWKSTYEMVAIKGRAAYLGERSKNHLDPGATSSYLILKTIVESVNNG